VTLRLNVAHLAVALAFLMGVGVVALIALVFGGGDASSQVALVPTATPTAAMAPAREPGATSAPTASPTSAPPTEPPSPTEAPSPTARAAAANTASAAAPTQAPTALPVSTPVPAAPGDGYAFIGAVWADESIPVPYCVNPANPPIDSNGAPIMSDEAFAAAVRSAFQTWENVSGSYIAFSYTGLCSNDPFDRLDRVNTVGWGWLFSTAIGVAAPGATHGQFLRESSFGQIYELDLVIDVRFAQSFDDESEYINEALPPILLHEIGHFIGLDHTNNPCSIMQPVYGGASTLCEVDANGARALYPQ
jgi:hypothetical protein